MLYLDFYHSVAQQLLGYTFPGHCRVKNNSTELTSASFLQLSWIMLKRLSRGVAGACMVFINHGKLGYIWSARRYNISNVSPATTHQDDGIAKLQTMGIYYIAKINLDF